MARDTPTDRRACGAGEFSSLFKCVVDATPGDMTDEERVALTNGAAQDAIMKRLSWTGPNGATYVAVGPDGTERGDPGWMICKYRKLRDTEWFVADAETGEVRYGPMTTKRHALHQIGAKRGKTVEAGWYTAKGHNIFRRDKAEAVLGRELTDEER